MSYEKKRFCFYCKLDTDRLEKLNKSLKKCGICKLAEYCGKECQRLDFPRGMNYFCVVVSFVFMYHEGIFTDTYVSFRFFFDLVYFHE
jgi:hypothetical protein